MPHLPLDKFPAVFAGNNLEECMATRRSVRRYSDEGIDVETIGRLLWAAYGKNNFRRTVPSAGAIYPLIVYYIWEGSVFRYLPDIHGREVWTDYFNKMALHNACLGQKSILVAPLVLIVAADFAKIKRKYKGRGKRYATLEAGHVGQNVHLMCEALGLGCVMIGAFSDRKVQEALGITEVSLYVIPIGRV